MRRLREPLALDLAHTKVAVNMTQDLTPSPLMVLGVATIAAVLGLAVDAHARQLPSPQPHVEAGARLTTLSASGFSGVAGAPQLTWNLDPRTAIEASANFMETRRYESRVQVRQGFVQLKRTLFTSGSSSLFAVAGGTAGTLRRTSPPLSFQAFNGTWTTMPGRTTTTGIGGFLVGAGYERVLAAHLKLSAEAQLVIGRDLPMFRTLIGVSTPLGRYRRRPAVTASSASSIGKVDVGQIVWVTMREGTTWKGMVSRVDAASIELERNGTATPLRLADVLRIEAPDYIGDGIGRGALIGAAAGGIPAVVAVATICANEGGECAGYMLLFGMAWGGIGAGVGAITGALADSLHEGRRTVWEPGRTRVAIAPIITRRSAGVGAVIRW